MTSRRSLDLGALIEPLSLDEFLGRHWEQEPLVAQCRAAELESLLEVGDFEFLAGSLQTLDAKWIRLVNSRPGGPMREFQRAGGGLAMERVLEAYGEGTTVVLNDLQQRWPAIRDLARCLWSDFNDSGQVPLRAVGVNAYLSPRGAQGLPVHFDSHCVFILQLSGRKRWTLYDAREELPSPDGMDRPTARGLEALENPLHERVLEPGDVVYIPRGLAHKAETEESHSLHLAVGLYPFTWSAVLAQAMRTVAACRRSLPRGIFSEQVIAPEVVSELARAAGPLFDPAILAAALEDVRAEIRGLREHASSDRFDRQHAIEEIDGSTRVAHASGVRLRLVREGEKVILENVGGARIAVPAAAESALRYVVENGTFSVDSLPDALNDSSKKVVVRRLLREGVLELASRTELHLVDPGGGAVHPSRLDGLSGR